MTSVLLVDDDPGIRFLERMVLKVADAGFTIVGEASSGEEAMARWRDLQPDVVVLDDRLPGLTGLEVAGLILAEHPGQLIVLFTHSDDEALAARARVPGVRVCLPKTELRALPARLLPTRRP
jgi:DNA-binding NarL/FixJ family response regulator